MRTKHFYNQTPLYEKNYSKLMQLAPYIHMSNGVINVQAQDGIQFYFQMIEQHRYTTLIQLSIHFKNTSSIFVNPLLKINIYHDAKVAEVIGYQKYKRLEPAYPYPNKMMFHRDEKHQVNQHLSELLDICLKHLNSIYNASSLKQLS